jgi:hypothetical protein
LGLLMTVVGSRRIGRRSLRATGDDHLRAIDRLGYVSRCRVELPAAVTGLPTGTRVDHLGACHLKDGAAFHRFISICPG